jgi:ubiquitin C-terminal hydrolase
VIELSPDIDNQQLADDDLERFEFLFSSIKFKTVLLLFSALELSRESIEQMIDESDIAERKSSDEPVGLKNIGNTCWFNSIVQALYTLPYFRQLILNFQYLAFNRVLSASVCRID